MTTKLNKIKILLILVITCLGSQALCATNKFEDEERQYLQTFILKHDKKHKFVKLLDEWTINFLVKILDSIGEINEHISYEDRVDALQVALWQRWDNQAIDSSTSYTDSYEEKKFAIEKQVQSLVEMGIFNRS